MSFWNQDNVRDVAESLGLVSLSDDVTENLARDVEYRIAQLLDEALKFMRISKRTTLTTGDIDLALRQMNQEPLYGYEAHRPLRFGEASLGPGQPLFYVEDEEVELEKLINAPLPKVPREQSMTGHWLSVDGVQPPVPGNPTAADTRNQELTAKGPNASAASAAMVNSADTDVKPLVKHVISRELRLYFDKLVAAFLDTGSEELRMAAYVSLTNDAGLQQLVPYFVQFISEKVTHNLKDLFILNQMIRMSEALVQNKSIFFDPYVAALVPAILTCVIGRDLGDGADVAASFALRDVASSLLGRIAEKYSTASLELKPRLVRSLYHNFTDVTKPFSAHYGAVKGLLTVGGPDVVRGLVAPMLKLYGGVLSEGLADPTRQATAEVVTSAILFVLQEVCQFEPSTGTSYPTSVDDEMRARLAEKCGDLFAKRVADSNDARLAHILLHSIDYMQTM